jgi:hypothetical protein
MKEEDKRLDQLFKKRLSDTDNSFAYNEEDWDKLELLLNEKEKRQRLIWIRVITAIAAIALLFTSFWIFKVTAPLENDPEKLSGETIMSKRSQNAMNNVHSRLITDKKKSLDNGELKTNSITKKEHTNIPLEQKLENEPTSTFISNTVAVIDTSTQSYQQRTAALILPQANVVLDTVQSPNHVLLPNKKQTIPLFAISVIASSDINGVNSLKKGKRGSNYGVLLSVALTKRITLQTGASYALKPYDIEYTYANAYAYKVNPLSASANCEMLDIPFDINFAILNHPKNKIGIGTGLSSYIMLHENYRFNYAPTAKANTSTYVIANSKSYLFSMLNVAVTYEHKLGPNLGILVRPYLKVPLKEVGYSNVKLHSAGVAMGLQMNINRKK